MPREKDLKRLVRARMKKTGEAYTAARAQILRKSKPAEPPVDYAAIAGKRDAIIVEKTGHDWATWIELLDREGAMTLTHGEVAAIVNTKYKVPGWWAQTVTVGYERIRGKRVVGQRMDGSYEASKSRTFNVPVKELFDAWADAKTRRRWLNDPAVKVRTATSPKSMRLGFPDGTIVAVGFMPKGDAKSAVAIQHTKLPDQATATRDKKTWSEYFDELASVLRR